jgi:parallel beta-helix repeat protein
MLSLLTSLALVLGLLAPPLPVIDVTEDDTVIDRSCIIRIAPDLVIADANANGILHIAADGITVVFEEGSVLRGAGADVLGDQLTGMGIRIDGHRDVTIQNAAVSGFKVGISARQASGLTIDGADLSGNFQQRLRSTAQAEDNTDWLWPHENDNDEWVTRYGAALTVNASDNVTIRKVIVRRGQNGIVLDRVNGSRIYDNDCSFLSGWGLAMWRSSRNIISRNAFDFCIRGYSHGFYNRGQDSAGILMFEQCEENVIIENSATHGGDGLFGYAGREAVGERPHADPEFYARPRGNNGNIIAGNDFSYAAAHGLEMTFSHRNAILNNRFAGNAICGIWAGYSQDTLIADNTFKRNGDAGYGLERGGVNIEHGSRNRISRNTFQQNACGVHLWWDDDGPLLERPGIKPHYDGVSDNIIDHNRFEGDKLALHLRDLSEGDPRVKNTVFHENTVENVETEIDMPERLSLKSVETVEDAEHSEIPEAIGENRPAGARSDLAGRQNIVMTEWGPWDHQGPLVRPILTAGRYHMYEFHNIEGRWVRAFINEFTTDRPRRNDLSGRWVTTLVGPWEGIFPYKIVIDKPGFERIITGCMLHTKWDVVFFPWEGSAQPPRPPADLDAWRALADGPDAVRHQAETLSFRFGTHGPSQLQLSPEVTEAKLGRDFFGMIAKANVPLLAGEYRIRTLSDDGVRVLVDGDTVLENWTHHGPTSDEATFTLDADRTVEITVEYFEIAGYAVLEFEIEPTFLDMFRAAAP